MKSVKFSKLVRAWREERELSRAEAARKLGIPYRTLQDWEAGKRTPRGFARQLITEKLGIPIILQRIGLTPDQVSKMLKADSPSL